MRNLSAPMLISRKAGMDNNLRATCQSTVMLARTLMFDSLRRRLWYSSCFLALAVHSPNSRCRQQDRPTIARRLALRSRKRRSCDINPANVTVAVLLGLEEEIKIHERVGSVIAEVGSVLRVGDVIVHLQGVGVVGDVAEGE